MGFCHDLQQRDLKKPTPSMQPFVDAIPPDTDILAIHGPVYGHRDVISRGISVGSVNLRDWAHSHRPAAVVCGHIHEARGWEVDERGTTYVNVACVTQRYHAIEDAAYVVDVGVPRSRAGGASDTAQGGVPDVGALPSEELQQAAATADAPATTTSADAPAATPFRDVTDPAYVPILHRKRAAVTCVTS